MTCSCAGCVAKLLPPGQSPGIAADGAAARLSLASMQQQIDDMEPAYKRYCSTYLAAFDNWEPVQSTAALHSILADVSGQLQAAPSFPSPAGGWTLDSFFILPYQRLRYYKKLYARLLKRSVGWPFYSPARSTDDLCRPHGTLQHATRSQRSQPADWGQRAARRPARAGPRST